MSKKLGLAMPWVAILIILTLAHNVHPVNAEPVGIGEWASDGRIALCVHSFNSSPSLSFYPYTPKTAGYVFAWVDLSLKNVGTKKVSTNSLYAYLRDTDNYFYEYVYTDSPKKWQLIDLPPGETFRGEIYWEVPPEAIIDRFVWTDPWSYITVIIPEFPSFLILSLFMIATLLAVMVYKRKHIT